MRGPKAIIFQILVVIAIVVSCDTTEPSFDDTLPEVYRFTAQVSPDNSGSVVPSVGDYEVNKEVEVQALPFEGYVFERWEGDLSSSNNPESLIIDDDKSVTAIFSTRDYPLNIFVSGNGTVSEILKSRTADSVKGRTQGNSGVNQDLKSSKSGTTNSHPDQSKGIKLSGAGTIEVSKNGNAATVELKAEPEEGWYFAQWEGDLSGDVNPEVIVVDEEKNVTAVFLQEDDSGFSININVVGEGEVFKDPDRSFYNEGDNVTLTASSDEGWRFDEWQGDIEGTENSKTVTIEENLNITAVFEVAENSAMSINQQPTGTVAGTSITPSPAVKILSGLGEPIEGVEIDVSLSENNFTSESTTSVRTNSEGIAVFSNLVIETAFPDYILMFDADEPLVQDISSKPFGVTAAEGDPSKTTASISEGIAGMETEIRIFVRDQFENAAVADAEDLTGDVTGTNVKDISIIKTDTDGRFNASYVPEMAGTDQINIKLKNVDIQGSPFESRVQASDVDPANSEAVVPDGVAGEETEIKILINDAFGNPIDNLANNLEVVISGKNSSSPDVESGNSVGEYLASYIPEKSGVDQVSVRYNDQSIRNSPYRSNVSPAEADPDNSTANITEVRAGEESVINVSLMDRFGNSVSGEADELRIQVGGANNATPSITETNREGRYEARYVPVKAGLDEISVTLDDTPIKGSPYEVEVSPSSPDLSNSDVSVSGGIAGEDVTIKVSLKDQYDNLVSGFSNRFEVRVNGANNKSPQIQEIDMSGEYMAGYTPEKTGTDRISILFDDAPVNSSPFEISIDPGPIDRSLSIVSAKPNRLPVGETALITVNPVDAFSNPITELTDNEFDVKISGDMTIDSFEEISGGRYIFEATSKKTGANIISVSVNGVLITDTANVTFEPGEPDELVIITQPRDSRSGEPIKGPPTVRVIDEFGNPVPGIEVTVKEKRGEQFFEGDETKITNNGGVAIFDDIVLNRLFGTFRLVFSVDGLDDYESESFQITPFNTPD